MLLRRFLTVLLLLVLLLPAGTSRAADPINLKPTSYLPFVFASNQVGPGSPCQLVTQSPADGSILKKGTYFIAHWVVKNTTIGIWYSDSTQIRFISGDRLHAGADALYLPYDVAPGEQIEIAVAMHAPDTAGNYTANWALVSGPSPVCTFFVNINVL